MKTNKAALTGIAILLTGIAGLYFFKERSVFKVACKKRLEEMKYAENKAAGLCGDLEKRFFSDRKPIQEILPSQVNAPSLPIDGKIRFVAFHNPAYLSSFAYCYFAFRGWFNPKEMSPKQIALAASGFAILKSELTGYPGWLKSDKGIECVKSLQDSIQMGAADLMFEMGDKLSVIAFNPVGAIRSDDGMAGVLKEALLTVNHERIHAIHVTCPDVDKAATKHWDSLSLAEREKLKEGHLNYDWGNRTVAVREAFAYFLEDQPTKVLDFIGHCSM